MNEAQSSKNNSDVEDVKALAQADISEWMINTLAAGGEIKLTNDAQVAEIIIDANKSTYDEETEEYGYFKTIEDNYIITKKGNKVSISSLYTPTVSSSDEETSSETPNDE